MYRPLLEKTKGTNEGKSQVLSRFFHLYQCTSENDFHLHGIFLSYIGASGGTRINTGFLAHLYISLSQARGQRTAERLKVSSTFSKVAGCGTASHGPKGVARTVGPAFPYSKKGGTNVPLLGWHRARGRHRACRKLTQSLRLCQGTPDEGSLRKAFRWKPFLPSCVCRRRLRPRDAVSRSASFLKKT